jgi:transposase-like protein
METNLVALMEEFGNDHSCRAYLEALRWPDGVKCLRCGSDKVSRLYKRDQFDCGSCRYQFSVTVGTIFNDTHLSLWKWFLAAYMMCEAKKGVSASQLSRSIKVAYKTAWYLCHRIRMAMSEVEGPKVRGPGKTVEMEETYVGGPMRHVGSGYLGNKTMVLGAPERGGEVRLRVERRSKGGDKNALHCFVAETTKPDTSRIRTDDNPGCVGIEDADTRHESVNHSAEEWVRGDVHTNGIEGAWSLFKRSIVGSYHQVSAKHLERYLEEFEWRFNQRENPFLFRDTLTRLLNTPKMEFKELIEKGA